MGRELCKMFKDKELDHGNILLKFLLDCRNFPTMSPDVVWKMLYFGGQLPFPRSLPDDPGYTSKGIKRGPQGVERLVPAWREKLAITCSHPLNVTFAYLGSYEE